ncbi:MAG: helix-turn-helix domain-containing protein [Prevotella sp.]
MNPETRYISIAQMLEKYPGSHIGNELLLIENIESLRFDEEPRQVKFLLLALCLQGSATYMVDTRPHTVKANDIIIISPGQTATDVNLSEDCHGMGIIVSYNFFREIIKDMNDLSSLFLFARNHPVFELSGQEVKHIVEYVRMMKEKIDYKSHSFRKEIAQSLFTTMIYDLSDTIERSQGSTTGKNKRSEMVFTNFIRLAEKNFKKERKVKWYAQQLSITPKYLSETVKAVSQRTPNDWLDNYICIEICVQLRTTTKSIKEIASELHFTSQSQMGKFFKDNMGISPKEYRRS